MVEELTMAANFLEDNCPWMRALSICFARLVANGGPTTVAMAWRWRNASKYFSK